MKKSLTRPPGLWFLVIGGLPVLVDLPRRLCPVFGTADMARQFADFAGLTEGIYPAQPTALEWALWLSFCRGKRCRGLVMVSGVEPWEATAVEPGGRWTEVNKPDVVLV